MIGEVVDSYRLTRKLGEGGMGVVYEAVHVDLGRKVAVKLLLPELSAQPSVVERFFNEARAATAIHDPGIVQIFDFGYQQQVAYIVMELLSGESLEARIQQRGTLSTIDAARIVRQAATSLQEAHAAGIVHRDLKPENIFLVRDREVPGGERTKILDFGIAKLLGDAAARSKTRAGSFLGTPDYASPEQCRDAGDVDHRSDIYALGCILFRLATGRTPFSGHGAGDLIAAHLTQPAPVPSAVVPGLSSAFDGVVARCLAKDPDRRYPTMGALAEALHELCRGTSVNEVRVSSPVAPTQFAPSASTLSGAASEHDIRTARTRGRSRTGLLIGVLAALAIVAVAAAVLLGGGKRHDASADHQPPVTDVIAPAPNPEPITPPETAVVSPVDANDAPAPETTPPLTEPVVAKPAVTPARKPVRRPKEEGCFEGICTR